MVSRRRFVQACLLVASGPLIPCPARAQAGPAPAASARLLDPRRQPRFVNPLPNLLDPDLVFRPTAAGGRAFEVSIRQFRQPLGLVDPQTGQPLLTTVWGYGTATGTPTSPGRTFVVRQGSAISVRWENRLADEAGSPVRHALPVDTTLHWADPLKGGHGAGQPYLGPVPLVTHLHGGDTESASDGLPDAWSVPGDSPAGRLFRHVYTYDNGQEAAQLWYHDHALGITRLNVFMGLAGHYIIRDGNEDALTAAGLLPGHPYEVPLVIQDRRFTAEGELHYPAVDPENPHAPTPTHLPEFFGDVILVNGKTWPVLEVEPRRYRFRVLNGSDSRFYTLSLSSGQPMYQIGTDLGLLDAPVRIGRITLAPGERADLILDFSERALRGKTVILRNTARTPYPKGEEPSPRTTGQIMAFRVVKPLDPGVPPTRLADRLRPVHGPLPSPRTPVRTRRLLLFEGKDHFQRLQTMLGVVDPTTVTDPATGQPVTLQGTLLWGEPTTETPRLGETELWEIYNTTADAHPMHLHLVGFQVLNRQSFSGRLQPKVVGSPPHTSQGAILEPASIRLTGSPKPAPATERGRKDTVIAMPGEVTRIVATFHRPGEYAWHCHILSHEDHEMMRPLQVLP